METQLASKSEFAALIGVTPGRVSQYIAEGKLGFQHLHGAGRSAKIRVDDALLALKLKLDPGQRMGNGLGTRLDAAPSAQAATPVNDLDHKFKLAKLEHQEAINRRAREDEAARTGLYTLTSEAKAEMSRIAAQILQSMEGAISDMAQALAAQYQLPQRDVVHFMRNQFKEQRAKMSMVLERDAAVQPVLAETDRTSD